MEGANYIPDWWVLVEDKSSSDKFYRVLAQWYGSYLQGNSCRINSGIKAVTKDGTTILVEGDSGKKYLINEYNYGLSTFGAMFLEGLKEKDMTMVVMKHKKALEILEEVSSKDE